MLSETTHAWHPYPAKFPPEAIRGFLESYTKPGDRVLDPFCGSGTTLVECRLIGRNAIGIELNPVGVLISRAKAESYTPGDVLALRSIVGELRAAEVDTLGWVDAHYSLAFVPDSPNRDHWFQPSVQRELSAVKSVVTERALEYPRLSPLLFTALSRIIVPVSNQDGETRYTAIDKSIPHGGVVRLYIKTLKTYLATLECQSSFDPSDVTIRVIEGDAIEEVYKLEPRSIDFAITSPPYINSFDYYLYHKQRIYWLEGDPRNVRAREIGLHHRVDTQSYTVATSEYISALTRVFVGVRRALKPGRRFVLLAGDGIVKGLPVDMAGLVRQIAGASGLEIEKAEAIPLRAVSRRFIKDSRIDGKRHHVITLVNRS
jgi:hypothetical protein